jgi:hypothetical protein
VDDPVNAAFSVVPEFTNPLQGSGAQPTPSDLIAHGWSCFTPPPFPTRTECSHPNQGFPSIPPPADRPATFTLWRFENGEFAGTLLAIRPDLYCGADVTDAAGTCTRKAPLCGSTGQPYSFVPVVGYTRAFIRRAAECASRGHRWCSRILFLVSR